MYISTLLVSCTCIPVSIFFFTSMATTEIYTLSLHDALPILCLQHPGPVPRHGGGRQYRRAWCADAYLGEAQPLGARTHQRSEEHTSELQSRQYLVCRLLLEKKNKSCSLERNVMCPAPLAYQT